MPVFALYNFDDADATVRDSAVENGAQNGLYVNGAFAAGGQAVLDGENDLLKIAQSPMFQMDRGTLDITWTMGTDPLTGTQTLLSRDSVGTTDGGYRIEILADGSVVISHETATGVETFGTAPGFANPGDTLSLSYSWDQGGTGGRLIVTNSTTGDSFSDTVPNTLTMDMSGSGLNQPWIIGAGQASSDRDLLNNIDQHFQGTVQLFQLSDTVDNLDGAPVANPDSATTGEDTPVTIPVLANDTDPTGQPLTVTAATAPNGTVTVNPDGTLTYAPDPNFNGPDTITYTITDPDGNTSTSTVAVTVTPVNDAPEANPDVSTTPLNTPVTFAVLGNDTDVDGDTLSILGTPTSPNGTVVVNPDGTLTFTPTTGFTGEAVVNYTITDPSGLTDSTTWTITVGTPSGAPVANPDSATTGEDTPVTIPVLANDSDPTGQPLTVTAATAPNGTVTVNPDGTLTYAPDPNFNGPDTITYTITDPDGNTSTSTVAVTVTPVNDAPEANPDVSTTPLNTPVTFAVLGNDTDVDGDTLSILGTPTSPNGTVVVNPDGTLTFTPTTGFTGEAVVNYTITDPSGLTDSTTWTINVRPDTDIRDGIVRGTDGADLIDAGYVDPFDADRVDNNDAILPGEVGNDDIIEAGAGNDTVLAGAGNDDVRGGDGDDSLNGGVGDDLISGDAGNDSIFGDTGNDTLLGGLGDDEIVGGLGDDSILGGDGNDALQGNEGNDTLIGNAGNDTLLGGAGDDLLDGGLGDDSFVGGFGNDTILGGAGDDTIQGNIGDDSILGGAGNDSIIGNEGNDTVDGGDGDDFIDTSGTAPLPDIDYPGAYPADTDPGNDLDLVFGGAGNDTILTGDDADTIFGGAGNDLIDAGIDADLVESGLGNDTIVGGEGADTIDGGDGNDLIFGGLNDVLGEALDLPDAIDLRPDNNRDLLTGGAGDDTIYGRDDDDTLFGGLGNDLLFGGIDEDSLEGGAGNDTLVGGEGADTMAGGDDRDVFLVSRPEDGIGDVIDGNEGGDDFDTLDLRGAGPLRVVFDPTNPENGTVTFLDPARNPVGTLTFTNIENVVPCFTPGTLIATPKGEVPVEHLKAGDRVITRDNGIQEIRWTGKKQLGWRDLAANPHLKPVLIRQGSLGNGLPERDMMVSPNHRMLVANDRTALYFDEHEVLVSAKHLVAGQGIQWVDSIGTTYIHFMFDRHEVVLGNGAWTESFQPGDQTLKGMGNAQRSEIFELFPELQNEAGINDYQAARRTLKKHEARLLVK
ncbi:Ig-like domain-containing protein [Tabrizicola sp.]|uniref:Ig-like domain-containing protein n=1 Tax=Tabrizicola sp. TaxID=2005166 RepID=UPI003D2A049F